MKKQLYISFFILLLCQNTYSINAYKPVIKFYKKSVKIGEYFNVSLKYKHLKSEEVLFPDTSYNFSPFEFVKKQVFPTRTTNNISTDSVVFTLCTFQLTDKQYLSLPIKIFTEEEPIIKYSNTDTIHLVKIIHQNKEKLHLRANYDFQTLKNSFDYIFWSIIIIGILIVLVLGYVFFGKDVRRQITLYFNKLAFERFVHDFDRISNNLNKTKSNTELEKLLSNWKKYLQNIINKPITTYTSKEVSELINNENLSKALTNIDRAIYGDKFEQNVFADIDKLKKIAREYYIKKQEEVKRG